MITLPKTLRKNGCFYRQEFRTDKIALYALTYKQEGPVIGHEVFMVKITERSMAFGRVVPRKEHFPSNEDFGKIAWSFTTRRTAMEKFQALESPLYK